jgi:hypothetical protein
MSLSASLPEHLITDYRAFSAHYLYPNNARFNATIKFVSSHFFCDIVILI